MEKEPKMESKEESPEEIVKRFVDFTINLGSDIAGGGNVASHDRETF